MNHLPVPAIFRWNLLVFRRLYMKSSQRDTFCNLRISIASNLKVFFSSNPHFQVSAVLMGLMGFRTWTRPRCVPLSRRWVLAIAERRANFVAHLVQWYFVAHKKNTSSNYKPNHGSYLAWGEVWFFPCKQGTQGLPWFLLFWKAHPDTRKTQASPRNFKA